VNRYQQFADKALSRKESTVRFSIGLEESTDKRLECLATEMDVSKSALCSDLVRLGLDELEPFFKKPSDVVNNDSLPTTESYIDAFQHIRKHLTKGHTSMLSIMCEYPEKSFKASGLASAAGYKGYGGANLQLGRIGYLISEYLKCPIPKHSNGDDFYSALIVQWTRDTQDECWRCKLHPQVQEALSVVDLDV